MSKYRVYESASTQKENIGVGQYGTEQDRMMFLADRTKYWLGTQVGKFEVFRNQPGWSLQQTINDCNKLACDIIVDNHTNAGPLKAAGTEVYYHASGSGGGKRLAQCILDRVGPVSPGPDRGVLSDFVLYKNGLGILRDTNPPAVLVEHFYHSNLVEVDHYLLNVDKYAKAGAQGVCAYFGEKWVEPTNVPVLTVAELVNSLFAKGLITDTVYWTKVLKGETVANPEFLQILFGRFVNNIR